jgi:L-alanine-DL-glutamate epimerase-like enolase superfamily enzyme
VPHEPYEYGVTNPFRITAAGEVDAPDAPGLGVAIDWERMESATIASFTCP